MTLIPRRSFGLKRPPAWGLYLAVIAALVAVYMGTDNDGLRSLLYNSHSAVAAAIVGLCAWRLRPDGRAAWFLIAAGIGAFSAGDWIWAAYEHIWHVEAPFPSLADPVYLAGAAVLALGMWRLVSARGTGRGDLQDTAIVMLTVGLFTWVQILGPSWQNSTDGARVVAIAYPVCSALLLTAALRLLLSRMGHSPATLLLAVGMTSELVADTIYSRQVISGTYAAGWLDVGWIVAYAAIAAAALHPSAARIGRRVVPPGDTLTTRRLALLMGVIAVAPLALLVPSGPSYPVFLMIWLGVLTLTAARLTILVRRLGGKVLTDDLTGLVSRFAFGQRLQAAVTDLERDGGHLGVVFCDVDHFKLVNDSYGHAIGDAVLRAVADRLAGSMRQGDIVARLGGDEFAVLVPHTDDPGTVHAVAGRILDAFVAPLVVIGFGELYVAISVGVRTSDDTEALTEVLLADADMAMYRAKDAGGRRQAGYEPELREDVLRRLHLENDLRAALDRDELHLVYQPEFAVATGKLFGVEALSRWNHPTLGLIPPDEFIPMAEAAGLIDRLFDWSLDAALRQHAEWRSAGRTVAVSVNLSASQLTDPRLVDAVASALERHDVRGDQLWIEVTESALAGGDAAVRSVLELKQLDVGIAIDDFGTGYSSLSQLRRLPFDILKIDRTFIAPLGQAEADDKLLASIIQLAHGLDVRTVAEGVETEEQARILTRLGCDIVQGYLYARPTGPADALAVPTRTWNVAAAKTSPEAGRQRPGSCEPSAAKNVASSRSRRARVSAAKKP
jgi:diguanylate cyclase (GGDEF)-like protein